MSDPDPLQPPEEVPAAPPGEEARYPFWNWGDALVFVFLLLPCFVGAALITEVVLRAFGVPKQAMAIRTIPAQFLGYGLGFGALWLMFKTRYQQPFWRSLAWRVDKWAILPSLMSGVVLAVIVMAGSILLRTKPVKTPMEEMIREPGAALMLAVFAVTLGPICEELLFRGFMQPLLVRTVGVPLGILIAAVPFALLHGPQYAWSWQHVTMILFAGVMFGATRQRTGSTALAALMHAGYNFTFVALLFIQQGYL